MRNLLKPKWLLVINTLPLVLLFILFYSQFTIIRSLLSEESIRLWNIFSSTLGSLGLFNLAYIVYLIWKKKEVSNVYAYLALLVYIPFIYLYGYHLNDIIPFSIPSWMLSANIFLYVGTFLMPTLAYSLIVMVMHFTPEHKEHKAWLNFLAALSIPLLSYLFTQLLLPLWKPIGKEFDIHFILILLLAITLVFLFFLIRTIYIVVTKRVKTWRKHQLVWKIPVAILLPILGLMINNGHILSSSGGSGVFGDFGNYWFYILAGLNGTLVCLPNLDHKHYRLFLYLGRSITFAYTFYFFLVFLPFLPLSVVAIIAIGTGFLMLVPLLLFVLHLNQIAKDFTYLKVIFSKRLLLSAGTLSFVVLPAIVTLAYLEDKAVLNETLTYLYSPDYAETYEIDTKSLQQTLQHIKNHRGRGSMGLFEQETPYLSSYFNWLVLDNLSLPRTKIKKIESVFFDEEVESSRTDNIRNEQVEITHISSSSSYDEQQKAWISWVDLEITNFNESNRFAEYSTSLELPEGCWISDYYLYVGVKKEAGILAEKKSAMWIFSQIRNENRDPGILYYLTANEVAFRVFPFAKEEVRRTGISFLHKDPVRLQIDGHEVQLGEPEERQEEIVEVGNIAYIPATQKQKLQAVRRQPYYHFLVDISEGKEENVAEISGRVEQLLSDVRSLAENAKISFVNSQVATTLKVGDNWQEAYATQRFEGGFYLDRAIRKTLVEAYQVKTEQYPVLIVLTDSLQQAVLDKSYEDLAFTFPESDLFYYIDHEGNLEAHSLIKNPLKALPEMAGDCSSCEAVLVYRFSDGAVAYLEDDEHASIVMKNSDIRLKEGEVKERNWLSALKMQGLWNAQILQPQKSDSEWLTLLKYSFKSKVMTPVSSYLVVENEAQKAMLEKKQEEVLSGNPNLDPGEEVERMSEPSCLLLLLLLAVIVWSRERKRRSFY